MAWANKASVAMTGSAVAYTIPANTRTITILPVGGDITLAWTSGGAAFPLYDKAGAKLTDPNLGGLTVYLTGAVGVTVYAMYNDGLMA